MRPLLAALGFFVCLTLTAAWPGARARAESSPPPSSFTPAQRAEIVQIIRDAMKADPTILRDAVTALQADEASVKEAAARAAIGQAGAALTKAPGDPVAGNPAGDVTVVEFYDLRCPYCRKMQPVMAQLLQSDPKIRLVYKDIPILGPASVLGARAVLAAQKQGGYQKLHDLVMAGPPTITEMSLRADAGRAGLDWDRLQRDMADPSIEKRLSDNLELAHQLGIEGTPAYVIGPKLLPGAVDLAELQQAVAAVRTP
jgi:protein-disulfide isomerase